MPQAAGEEGLRASGFGTKEENPPLSPFIKGGSILRHPSMNSGQVLRMTGEIVAPLPLRGSGQ